MATYRNIIKGLEIFAKHDGDDGHLGGSDHDIIWGCALTSDNFSAEELAELEAAGWHWSVEFDCWTHYT